MPANSTTRIQVLQNVVAESSYAFSAQDDLAVLSQIPSGGTILFLPTNPSTGDEYAFADGDGSTSSADPITLTAGAGATIQGASALVFTQPYASATAQYNEQLRSWVVRSDSSVATEGSNLELLASVPVTFAGTLAPGASQTIATLANTIAPGDEILVAYDVNIANQTSGQDATVVVDVIAYGATQWQNEMILISSPNGVALLASCGKPIPVQSGTRNLSVQLTNAGAGGSGTIAPYLPEGIGASLVNFYAVL